MAGQPVKRGTMAHDTDVFMLLTEAAVQQRDAAALAEFAPRLATLATAAGHPLYLAIARRARGVAHRLAGDLASAEARLAEALALLQPLEARWQMGRTLFELGALEQARGQMAAARQYFSNALASFEQVKAPHEAARAQAALADLD